MITLYGVGLSLYVRKVRFALAHKELEFELKEVLPHNDDPIFIKNSPLGKVPVLTDGDFGISDSSVIVQYLDKKYPQNSLYPQCPEAFAKALWFEEYSDTKVTEIISGIFFQKVAKPMLMGEAADEEIVKEKEKEIPGIFDYLEKSLQGKNYLVADELTIADISLLSNLVNYFALGNEIDTGKWPLLAAYAERLTKLPQIKEILELEKEATAKA